MHRTHIRLEKEQKKKKNSKKKNSKAQERVTQNELSMAVKELHGDATHATLEKQKARLDQLRIRFGRKGRKRKSLEEYYLALIV